MEKEDYDIKTEKLNSILQVLFYAMMLGKEKGELVFLSKDDLCIYQHYFLLSEFKDVLDNEIANLKHYWSDKIIPIANPRCYGVDKKTGKAKECQDYCPYRDYCKSQAQEEYSW